MPIPLLVGLGLAGAAGVGSAIANAIGSSNAADAQRRSAEQAMALQREMYQQQRADQQGMYAQQRADQAPWLEAGRMTLADLLSQMRSGAFDQQYQQHQFDPSMLANDPGFQFRLAEGQKALERSAAARGGLNSGAFMRGLARYSQGLASDEYQNAWGRSWAQNQSANAFRQAESGNRFNRLASLAGVGQASAQHIGSLGAQHAGNLGQYAGQHANSMSNLHGAVGNANAAGAMGVANAFGSGFQTLGNLATMGTMSLPTQAAPSSYWSGWNPYGGGR